VSERQPGRTDRIGRRRRTAFGLDGVVRDMREEGKLSAVFNGVDVDPSTDPI